MSAKHKVILLQKLVYMGNKCLKSFFIFHAVFGPGMSFARAFSPDGRLKSRIICLFWIDWIFP